ncbi:MAG TPA: hypothetical protein DDZ51_16690 [Planctomycetaceae bacterium]|nr:hypothetical protein [Planctomycetaceae bacterium]
MTTVETTRITRVDGFAGKTACRPIAWTAPVAEITAGDGSSGAGVRDSAIFFLATRFLPRSIQEGDANRRLWAAVPQKSSCPRTLDYGNQSVRKKSVGKALTMKRRRAKLIARYTRWV